MTPQAHIKVYAQPWEMSAGRWQVMAEINGVSNVIAICPNKPEALRTIKATERAARLAAMDDFLKQNATA